MAASIAGGAVLGTAISELYRGVHSLATTSTHFPELARGIESKLERMLPLIQEIQEHNMECGLPNQHTEKLKSEIIKGLELVGKCSKVALFDVWNRRSYTKQLRKLDHELKIWLEILTLEGVRNGMQTLVSVRTLKTLVLAIFVVAVGKVTTTIIFIIRGSQTSYW